MQNPVSPTLQDTSIKVCSRCIYDARVSAIIFDTAGVCNYCRQVDDLVAQYGTGSHSGGAQLADIIENIKRAGIGKRYDCVIGVSGGTDSSYMVHLAKKSLGPSSSRGSL